MRCLRSICGVTLRDRVRNDDIREKCGIQKLSSKVARHQLRWYGHVARMDPERLTHRVRYWNVPESWKRPRGRPKLRWLDCVKKNLGRVGIKNVEDADVLAQDRNEWREKIHSLDEVEF